MFRNIIISSFFILLFLSFWQLPVNAQGDHYSYFYFDKIITLKYDGDKYLVKFKDGSSYKQVENNLSNLGFSVYKKIEIDTAWKLYIVKSNIVDIAKLDILKTVDDLDFIMPIFKWEDGTEETVTNQFIVKFKDNVTLGDIIKLNEGSGIRIIKQLNSIEKSNRYLLGINWSREKNVFEIANSYQQNPLVEYATPDFIIFDAFNSVTPNDTYYANQWGLPKINASNAWDISEGSSSIIVAVLDEGVDINHEDLNNNLIQGYDPLDGDDDPQPYGNDAHAWTSHAYC